MSTPVLTVSVPPPAQASGSTPPSVDDGACLLLHADDDARRTLVDLLQMCFARVHVCASYVEWMQLQQHQQQHQPLPRPHLIIMDAASVGGDEQELLALFRTDALLKSVPIIALTSTASEDAVLALVEAGATDVLRKPVQFTTLRDSCIACTQSSVARTVALAAAGDASSATNAFNPSADVLVIDSDEAARTAIQTALESIGYACTCVANYMHSAATLLSTAPYHLIVIGLGVSSVDRDLAAARVRELLGSPHVSTLSVFLMCEARDASSLQKFYEMGIDDHLLKPLVPVIVQTKFSHVLRRNRIRQFSRLQIGASLKSPGARAPVITVTSNSSAVTPQLSATAVATRARAPSATMLSPSPHLQAARSVGSPALLSPPPLHSLQPSLLSQQLSQQHAATFSLSASSATPIALLSSSRGGSIDDYDLLSLLGEGAFGKVLMVRHRRSGKIYAMKILRKAEVARADKPRQAINERAILELIGDQPFVVRLYAAFQDEENLYLILRFAGGGDLFSQLEKRRRLPEEAARFYAAEIVLALEALHRANCVYRDLKPENVLLSLDGHVLLTDMGLSAQLSPERGFTSTSLCGTPEYLAPCIVAGEPHTFAVDWWCLGVILYEMLVGKTPFHSRDLSVVVDRILNEPVQPPSFVSAEAQSLIAALLVRDPRQRLGSRWQRTGGVPADGAAEVKAHPFFASVRWDRLAALRVTPPYLPLRDEVAVDAPVLPEVQAASALATGLANVAAAIATPRTPLDTGALFAEFSPFALPEVAATQATASTRQVGHAQPSAALPPPAAASAAPPATGTRLTRSASVSDAPALLFHSPPRGHAGASALSSSSSPSVPRFFAPPPIDETSGSLPSASFTDADRARYQQKISSLQINVDVPPSASVFSTAVQALRASEHTTSATSSPSGAPVGRQRAASISAPPSTTHAASAAAAAPFISPQRYKSLMPVDATSSANSSPVTAETASNKSFQAHRPSHISLPATFAQGLASPCPSPLAAPLAGPAQVRQRQRLAPVQSPSLVPMVRRAPVGGLSSGGLGGGFLDPRGLVASMAASRDASDAAASMAAAVMSTQAAAEAAASSATSNASSSSMATTSSPAVDIPRRSALSPLTIGGGTGGGANTHPAHSFQPSSASSSSSSDSASSTPPMSIVRTPNMSPLSLRAPIGGER